MTDRGVLDTSVFIAQENGRDLDESQLPIDGYISVITLGELHAGVLAAEANLEDRARRLATLNATADIELIGIDEQAALIWARMRAHLAQQGRRVNVNDLWIAASAAANGLPVVTQDDDFEPLEGVAGLRVIHV